MSIIYRWIILDCLEPEGIMPSLVEILEGNVLIPGWSLQ